MLTKSMRQSLSWLARQDRPMWGGHIDRGEPSTSPDLIEMVNRGLIVVVRREHAGNGYVITPAGRAALKKR